MMKVSSMMEAIFVLQRRIRCSDQYLEDCGESNWRKRTTRVSETSEALYQQYPRIKIYMKIGDAYKKVGVLNV